MIAAILAIKRFWPLALAAAALAAGWQAQGWRCESRVAGMVAAAQKAQAQALSATVTAYEDAVKSARQAATAYEEKNAELQHLNRTLTRSRADETRKDAYRCPLPAAGNRLLNAARAAAVPPADAAGKPDGRLP